MPKFTTVLAYSTGVSRIISGLKKKAIAATSEEVTAKVEYQENGQAVNKTYSFRREADNVVQAGIYFEEVKGELSLDCQIGYVLEETTSENPYVRVNVPLFRSVVSRPKCNLVWVDADSLPEGFNVLGEKLKNLFGWPVLVTEKEYKKFKDNAEPKG